MTSSHVHAQQAIGLLLQGMDNREIADQLHLKVRTIKGFFGTACKKHNIPRGNRVKLAMLLAARPAAPVPTSVQFNPKCTEVLGLITKGLSNGQIAACMGTSENMIKQYVILLMDATGMSTRLELALWSVNHL